MFATIQIDLTAIGRLVRENPDLAKKVNFKDGQHQLLNIIVGDKREEDKFGNNLNVNCKPKDAPKDNKWYIGQGKLWPENNSAQTATPSAPTPPPSTSSDPFANATNEEGVLPF